MFNPKAAKDRIRKGMRMARKVYSSARAGTTSTAKATSSTIAALSCRMGKIC